MTVFAAREAKNAFGRLLDNAQREPVTIEKKGRPVAVLLSFQEYQRLEKMQDSFWGMLAEKGEAEGYAGVKESEQFLAGIRHAED